MWSNCETENIVTREWWIMTEIGTKILFIDFVRSSEHLTKCAKCAPFLLFNFRSLPIVKRINEMRTTNDMEKRPSMAIVCSSDSHSWWSADCHNTALRQYQCVIRVCITFWFIIITYLQRNTSESDRSKKKRTASNNNNTIGRCDGRVSDNNNNEMITRIRCEQWNSSQTLSVGRLSLCFSSFVYVARSRILVFNAFGSNNFEASYVPVVSHIIIERRTTTASQKKKMFRKKNINDSHREWEWTLNVLPNTLMQEIEIGQNEWLCVYMYLLIWMVTQRQSRNRTESNWIHTFFFFFRFVPFCHRSSHRRCHRLLPPPSSSSLRLFFKCSASALNFRREPKREKKKTHFSFVCFLCLRFARNWWNRSICLRRKCMYSWHCFTVNRTETWREDVSHLRKYLHKFEIGCLLIVPASSSSPSPSM